MTSATKPTRRKPAPATPKPAAQVLPVANTVGLWAGSFGNEYTSRNQVDWQARVPFWQSAMAYCAPGSVFELGCNAGWNLLAIQKAAPGTDLYGADVNQAAVNQAREQGFQVDLVSEQGIAGLHDAQSMDLVFTAGVLIHVPPADLERTTKSLVNLSARYVLAIEYDADQEEPVEYRGMTGALWRRPYGAIYMGLGLKLLSFGEAEGFDRCTYYLLERQ